tara:strand:+ start:16659 stop:17132 length:474 start_codon:yes stop_codon:yes gene_type:complete
MSSSGKSRPLMESEIKAAQDESVSAAEAARKLNVSYNTYKKYAKLYGIMERCKCVDATGMPKVHNPYKGKYPLEELLMGMHPSYPPYKLRKKILGAKLKIEECDICGYSEKRITDNKVPLILAFKDGDRTNHILENLELVCYNCYHNVYGNLFGITK